LNVGAIRAKTRKISNIGGDDMVGGVRLTSYQSATLTLPLLNEDLGLEQLPVKKTDKVLCA